MRDEFDPYFDNGRKGWYQRELSGSRKAIYDKYENYSFNRMTGIVLDILAAYKGKAEKDSGKDHHRTIKISSNSMKEIHSKRK